VFLHANLTQLFLQAHNELALLRKDILMGRVSCHFELVENARGCITEVQINVWKVQITLICRNLTVNTGAVVNRKIRCGNLMKEEERLGRKEGV
jgi:hypothetical protein